METDDFESLVEGSSESPNLEFKGPCEWGIRTFVKDILAMSNVQDGGFIVVGIEDGTLQRLGLSSVQIDSFDIEQMQDQLAEFADSFVSISLHVVNDRDGKRFAVIRVKEFEEIPVISRIDRYDVKKGVLYFRSSRGRVGSKAISNSYDLRDVLDRSTVKIMIKRKSQGYEVADDTNQNYYENELGDL